MMKISARTGIQNLHPGMRVCAINRYSLERKTGKVTKVLSELRSCFINGKPFSGRHVKSVTIVEDFSDEELIIAEHNDQYDIYKMEIVDG